MRTREGDVNCSVKIERCPIIKNRCCGWFVEGSTRRMAGGTNRVHFESAREIPDQSLATGGSPTSPTAPGSPRGLIAMTSSVRWLGGLFLDRPHAQIPSLSGISTPYQETPMVMADHTHQDALCHSICLDSHSMPTVPPSLTAPRYERKTRFTCTTDRRKPGRCGYGGRTGNRCRWSNIL